MVCVNFYCFTHGVDSGAERRGLGAGGASHVANIVAAFREMVMDLEEVLFDFLLSSGGWVRRGWVRQAYNVAGGKGGGGGLRSSHNVRRIESIDLAVRYVTFRQHKRRS